MPFTWRFFPHVIHVWTKSTHQLRCCARKVRVHLETRIAHRLDARMARQVRGNHLRRVACRVARNPCTRLLFRSRGRNRHVLCRTRLGFNRLEIDYAICKATSGAMGGSASEEFLAVSEVGEDTFVRSTEGDYAANVEAVVTPAPAEKDIEGQPEAQEYDTPGAETIEKLVEWAQGAGITVDGREATAADTLKCMMVKLFHPAAESEERESELAAVLIPGDRELDEKRLDHCR